jgi:hypothetical protein
VLTAAVTLSRPSLAGSPPTGAPVDALVKATATDYDVTWAPVPPEAPIDTTTYGRIDATWERVVALAGDVMSGFLTLSVDPSAAMHCGDEAAHG